MAVRSDKNEDAQPVVETNAPAEHSVSSAATPRRGGGKTFTVTLPEIKLPRQQLTGQSRTIILVVAFFLLGLLGGMLGGWLQTRNNSTAFIGGSLSKQEKIVTSQSQLTNEIAKEVGPSVVSVNDDITSGGSSISDGFGLFGFSQPEEEEAAGTGIIISSNGIILTNRHVVPEGTTNVSVTLSNGTELKDVSVIGRTSPSDSLDVAFLKINNLEGQKLTPAVLGDSSQVQVGDAVVAIGNALGQFQNTVTSGIISGYGRDVTASADTGGGSSIGGSDISGLGTSTGDSENLEDLFQTDAAINEGNSGGPLVNMNGQVIGINTAIAGNAQNIGFSIPINDTKGLIEQVLKTGKFELPYLGIRYIPLTADVANEYNLSVQNGAFVAPSSDPTDDPSVAPGSPAANAGIEINDVITQVNGTNIDSTHSLTALLDQFTPGQKVTLTIVRSGKTLQLNVTLGTAPGN